MIKRFITICLVIGAALLALTVLGVSSLKMHERGLRAERQGRFVAVAEQIRLDVKSKLDTFLKAEQRRPYTDYQYAYVPETTTGADTLMRSPLADSLTHGLAFGHFQIDAEGTILMPYAQAAMSQQEPDPELATYVTTLRTRVLSLLQGQAAFNDRHAEADSTVYHDYAQEQVPVHSEDIPPRARQERPIPVGRAAGAADTAAARARTYAIDSLQETQQTQMMRQDRETAIRNVAITAAKSTPLEEMGTQGAQAPSLAAFPRSMSQDRDRTAIESHQGLIRARAAAVAESADEPRENDETVQIRIEPFIPLMVSAADERESVFPGNVFLIRRAQIENTHLLQGFQLNEDELVEQVRLSAQRLLREGMDFDLDSDENPAATHTAILDFGFGELVLNLLEVEPGWIAARAARLNRWLAAILTVVWLTVVLAMLGLWRTLNEQLGLARKKDDFISAVSHELRTPLTSIRMYTEMLEKDWVKDESKKREYYGTMRQESERLSRLIENVLDFSRLQRGKKQFDFVIGNVNHCIQDVIETMRPFAQRIGFVIETELSPVEPFAFDRDAVTQIIINLVDNALKYARDAQDKRIVIRTRPENEGAVIEVQDHGPGIPKSRQKRIFEAFYRCGDEATRQTNGTGLGLALVKRFAQAHRGTVEVLNAHPCGAVFRVRLAR